MPATFWRSSGPGLKGVLVPFTKAAVPLVDLSTRTIRVDRIAAGLVDDRPTTIRSGHRRPGRVSIRSVGRADRAMPGATGELPRQRADALSRNVSGRRSACRSPAGRSKPGPGRSGAVQIRDFATDRHRTVDDTPAGGGAGMVMRADVLARAIDQVSPPATRGRVC